MIVSSVKFRRIFKFCKILGEKISKYSGPFEIFYKILIKKLALVKILCYPFSRSLATDGGRFAFNGIMGFLLSENSINTGL